MVDRTRVEERLRRLHVLLAELNDLRALGRDRYLADTGTQLQVEHALQQTIQICIDVGAHLIAELGFETPTEYAEVFSVLADHEAIDRDLAEQLMGSVGTRNAIVHAYLSLNRKRIWSDMDRLDDFINFAKAVEGRMDST